MFQATRFLSSRLSPHVLIMRQVMLLRYKTKTKKSPGFASISSIITKLVVT